MDQIGPKNSEAYPLTEGCLHAPFSVTQGNPCLFNTSGVIITLECSLGNKKSKKQNRKTLEEGWISLSVAQWLP
jgi:hypothetical protein